MDRGHHSETGKSDWQKLQGGLTLQLDAHVWMNNKSQLIKNVVKFEIHLNENKRMVFMDMEKLKTKLYVF